MLHRIKIYKEFRIPPKISVLPITFPQILDPEVVLLLTTKLLMTQNVPLCLQHLIATITNWDAIRPAHNFHFYLCQENFLMI